MNTNSAVADFSAKGSTLEYINNTFKLQKRHFVASVDESLDVRFIEL